MKVKNKSKKMTNFNSAMSSPLIILQQIPNILTEFFLIIFLLLLKFLLKIQCLNSFTFS